MDVPSANVYEVDDPIRPEDLYSVKEYCEIINVFPPDFSAEHFLEDIQMLVDMLMEINKKVFSRNYVNERIYIKRI